jgi:23S rRNA (cytosine1962-C5)-methyltransferase
VIARIAEALAQRRSLLKEEETDMFRVADGAADGVPDLEFDAYAGRWLVQTRDGSPPGWVKEVCPALAESLYWKPLTGGKSGPPHHLAGEPLHEPFVGTEAGLRYWIDFSAGYSQGIFLDQRENRQLVRQWAQRGAVLNTFAYTCAFGLAAAAGGAETVNVDLSRTCLEWGQRNYALNGIDAAQHTFFAGDTFDFLKLLGKKGRRFAVIILDPPTFSRDRKGRTFRVEKDYPALVASAAALLETDGRMVCCTNQRALSASAFRALVCQGLPETRRFRIESRPMPPDFRGSYLKTLILKA